MLVPTDLVGVDETTARRIIVAARSIAPGIDSVQDGSEDHKNVIAILQGVALEVLARGSRQIHSQKVGPASITYALVRSSFDADDRAGLELLAGSSPTSASPVGVFPKERPAGRLWTETY